MLSWLHSCWPHSGIIPIPFGYCIPVLVIIWLTLKRTHKGFAEIGLSSKRLSCKIVAIGCLTGITAFLFLQFAFFPLLSRFVYLPKANLSDFNNVRHHLGTYLFVLAMGWLAGGLYEEIVFHGYIFTSLEKW